MIKLSPEQIIKIIGVCFIFGASYAAVKQDINGKASKDQVTADSAYIRQLDAEIDGVKVDTEKEIQRTRDDLDRTLTNISNRLSRMEDRLTEICKATRAGCR